MALQKDRNRSGLAVDLGGTAAKVGLVNGFGEILAQQSISTQGYHDPERVLERIGEAAVALCQQTGAQPIALGFGAPGFVDVKAGITRFLPNLGPEWNDCPVKEFLEPRVQCPVCVMNDVRVATLGELNFGHGKNYESNQTMVFMAIGTGLGGGIVIDGKLRLGELGAAGELGHMIVQPNGLPCGCGNFGCLETYVSGPALASEGVRLLRSGQAPILHEIIEDDLDRLNPRTMTEAALRGDQAVHAAILRMVDHLAVGVSILIHVLHPDTIVIGGGVANIGDLLFDNLRLRVERYVHIFPSEGVEIVPSKLGDRAGLLGAAALAMSDPQEF